MWTSLFPSTLRWWQPCTRNQATKQRYILLSVLTGVQQNVRNSTCLETLHNSNKTPKLFSVSNAYKRQVCIVWIAAFSEGFSREEQILNFAGTTVQLCSFGLNVFGEREFQMSSIPVCSQNNPDEDSGPFWMQDLFLKTHTHTRNPVLNLFALYIYTPWLENAKISFQVDIYIKPFKWQVWAAICVSIPVIAMFLFCVEKIFRDETDHYGASIVHNILHALGSFLQEGRPSCQFETTKSWRRIELT